MFRAPINRAQSPIKILLSTEQIGRTKTTNTSYYVGPEIVLFSC